MKAVVHAEWIFARPRGINELYQKYTVAMRAVIQNGGFIPPSTAGPRHTAFYIRSCFFNQLMHHQYQNDLSFEEHVLGMSSTYTGENGTFTFRQDSEKDLAKIVYHFNETKDRALSLEHLGAMVSVLGEPDSFDVRISDEDQKEILSAKLIESGSEKLRG